MHVKTVFETILHGAQWSDAVKGGQFAQFPSTVKHHASTMSPPNLSSHFPQGGVVSLT